MTRQIIIFTSIVLLLSSCRQQNNCDFKTYIKTINELKQPMTFRTILDFSVPNSTYCDSVLFGQNMVPVGVKSINNNNYAVLLVDLNNGNNMFLTTVDINGQTIDKIPLEKYNGNIMDSINQMAIFEMNDINYFLRKDSVIIVEQIESIGECTVISPRVDTFKFVNGKIVKK